MIARAFVLASTALALLVACSRHGGDSTPSRAPGSSSDGGALYLQHCSSCHGPAGVGMTGVFPPLAGDPEVVGNARHVIAAIALGTRGNIVVNGTAYDGVMPGWDADLNDDQLAAIVTYVRSAWHNHAPPVSAADVGAVTGR